MAEKRLKWLQKVSSAGAGLLGMISVLASSSASAGVVSDGPLRMEPIIAPNFVVDSNVESPSSNSPSAAHLGVKVCNTGSTTLTNVVINLGDLTNPLTSTGTPGVFPSRTVSVSGSSGYAGTFALQMRGGAADAVRTIPSLAPGECSVQYFFVTYPLKDPAGNSVAGAAPVTTDDLRLNYDFWASAKEGAATRRVSETYTVTMRNEISAMANKVWPNTTSKVPDKYLDAIEQGLGWRPDANAPQSGTTAQLEGIWYDLGNVGAGFDNDGDGLPDRNAWMQPVGDPSLYNPNCVRLVKCYGLVIVKKNDGTEQLIPFEDQLYFSNLPENNTGAVGLVFFEFIPLATGCSAQLTPYQEVASGFDNEKFNGDYGASSGIFTSTTPSVTLDKTGPAFVSAGGTATYTMTAVNTGTTPLGDPSLSLPFVFEDAIPAALVYVASSATAANTMPPGNSVVVSWSTDNGATWVGTEPAPASVTRIRWTLGSGLAAGAGATVGFAATLPLTSPAVTVDNTAAVKLGQTGELAQDSVTSFVSGINSLGDFIWRDLDRDGVQDGGAETGIANITVRLYYDADADGVLDSTDPLFATTVTDGSGHYSFANLPDGKWIAVVDITDPDLPAGYSLPDSATAAIPVSLDPNRVSSSAVSVLTADWPFIGALEVTKNTSPTTYGAGDLITYTIDLENYSAPVAAKTTPVQTSWSSTVTANRVAQNPTNAQGSPDSNYARLDQTASSDNLANSGLSFASPNGTITNVEYVFNGYLSQALVDDQLDLSINGSLFETIPTATINTWTGAAAVRAIDITSLHASWTWPLVQALTGNLKTKKTTSGDPGILWLDSIGIRVTTVPIPPPAGVYGPSTMDPVPLVDTYDPTKLQYVSATVSPTSVSAGTLSWSNLGPLNAGARKTIGVTFRALTPPDINANGEPDTTTALNTATSSGAYFVSGRPTNSDLGSVTVTINPRGSIGDLVWWDINADGIKDVAEPGLANVLVTLDNGAQTRTDASGAYLFTGLVDGTYTVTVTTATLPWTSFSQTKDPDATINSASTVTINNNDGLSTNNSYLDRDFGYDSALNVINGIVFQDNDGDGIQDPGENFLAGVTVTLSGTSSATTTTDANGFYNFGSLPNGTYTVTVTQPASTTQTLDPDVLVNNVTTVVASGGNLYANRNFAYKPSGTLTLGDSLYIDWNGNGAQDSGEEGIASVDVFLYEDSNGNGAIDPGTDALVATSVTSATGIYGFTGLSAGKYIVVVNTADAQFPAGVLQIQDYDGTRDSRAVVNLTSSLSTVDFGYQPQGTGSIGDIVFIDSDGDGVKDSTESGIANVTVRLYEDTNNNGVIDAGTDAVLAITTTGSTGTYLFSGLAAGNYLVDVDQNAASIPSDGYGNKYRLTTADPHDVTLAAAQTYLAADFGFAAAAAIGDFVFFDSNGNGTQDFAETGIPNVTVQLFLDANQDGQPDSPTPLATTVTSNGSGANPAGFYQFTNLGGGTYFVKVLTSTLPVSGGQPLPQTTDPDRDGVPVNDNSYPGLPPGDNGDSLVIVSLGGIYLGADFGYQPSGALGDFVWLDLNQDGVQDPGEPGLADVTVTVSNGTTTYTLTTDFDGFWSVANVPDGAWTVRVPAANFAPGGALENMNATYDADGGANSSVAITLTNGTVNLAAGNLGLDFGYKLSGSHAISGTVVTHDTGVVGTADDIDDFFNDGVDQDAGPQDEIELAGILVYLYTTGGDFLGTDVTDAAGNFSFSGLPSGGYRVIIGTTSQALQNSTLTTTTANNAAVTSVNASSGTSVIQTLTVGSTDVTNVDFAFVSNVNYDYGDLPLIYGMTTLQQDGARHIIPVGGATVYLGTAPDADTNGIATSLANGDDLWGSDDENGVSPIATASWTNGTALSGNGGDIQVSVTGTGWLTGWIDWNHDGDFLDPGEFVVSQAVSTGTVTLSFDIPAGTIGSGSESWLSRFRIFTTEPAYPLFSYTGPATNGEVEDLLIEKPVGASIGDLVWNDVDNDGVIDSGEVGLGGISVQLRDNTNAVVATQITSNGTVDVDGDGVIDPLGYYRFRGLSAGAYTVTVSTPPAGFTPSYDENGIATANTTAVTLTSGEQHLTADFGYAPQLASISGQVRYDTDADGNFADPDSGAAVVKIQLWTDPNGDGNPSDGVQVRETYTDANGNYTFTGVATGNYVVVEINPAGSTSTADVSGANDDRIPVVLTGTNVTGRDFLDTMPPTYAVSGTVYDDADATDDNVIGVGDTPIANVVIKLFLDRDGNGLVSAGDSELSSVVTDASGNYSFPNIPAGNYVVQETDPSGASSDWDTSGSLTDNQISVTVVNANVTGRNFLDDGYFGVISGSVLADTNGDGSGDIPLVGVTVQLFADADGNGVPDNATPLATQVTIAGGSYTFSGVVPGSYVVVEQDPAGYNSMADADNVADIGTSPADVANASQTDSLLSVNLKAGETDSGNDFVDRGTGSIGDYLWNDRDGDGVQDSGEPPLAGVRVFIDTNADGTWQSTEPTSVTSATGAYLISNLAPGTYLVRVDTSTLPAGVTATFDLDGVGTASRTNVTVGAGQAVTDADFGYRGNASIGDLVWNDTDSNGAQGVSEAGFVGAVVFIDLNGNGTRDTNEPSATTDSTGAYSITNLTPGTYKVIVDTATLPSGAAPTYDLDGTTVSPNGIALNVVLASAQNRTDVDFGFKNSATIGDYVWNDLNGNGIQETGEPGLAGVRVYIDSNGNSAYDSGEPTSVTDATGAYFITGLNVNNTGYPVRVDTTTLPAGLTPSYDLDGTGTPNAASATLAANEIRSDVDFGYVGSSTIGDYVWLDRDDDGVQEAGEPPLSGVQVFLDLNNNGTWESTEPIRTTDATGAYSFSGLAAGTYHVTVRASTLPDTVTATFDADGTGTANTATVVLPANTTNNNVDFGYAGTSSLGDYVWVDVDGDGVQDSGEPPLSGVKVFIDLDGNGLRGTSEPFATTDSSGLYTISSLAGGTYKVMVETSTLPAGLTPSYDLDGTATASYVAALSLGVNANVTTANFGYQGTGSITGTAKADTDNNNTGDTALTGVTVTLYTDPNGDGNPADGVAYGASVTTDSNGAYSFSNLPAGAYVIVETQPAGHLTVTDEDTSIDTTGSPADAANSSTTDNLIPVNVEAGEADTANTFVEEQPGTISGFVKADTDNDNIGDTAIEGVVLTLKDSSGNDIDSDPNASGVQPTTATTDSNGDYSFTNVPPGSYQVVEAQPAGYASVSDVDGGNLNTIGDVTLISVTADGTVANQNFVEEQPGTISGFVKADTDNDNIGDVGILNVTLTLYTDPNGDGDPSDGVAVGTPVQTNGSGAYSFTNVAPGDYVVVETQPAGYNSVSDGDVTQPNDDVANASLTDNRIPVSITAGEADTGNNFVEAQPGTISGTVLADTNNDNTGDVGIAGVVLTLVDANGDPVDDPNQPGVQAWTTTTDSNGAYSFGNLAPGTYGVVETQPAGYLSVSDVDGGNPNQILPIVVNAGDDVIGQDFVDRPTLASISGTVRRDSANDNTLDGNEPGIPGVTVTLRDSNGDVIATTVTDGSGNYTFPNLTPGNYTVVETDPAGATSDADVDGVLNGNNTIAVTLAGTNVTGRDFLDSTPTLAGISGSVYEDGTSNDNLIGAGDSPIGGVTISLYKDLNSDGIAQAGELVSTTVTATDGSYGFTDLPNGSYLVVETDPAGAVSDADTQGTNDNQIAVTLTGTNSTGNNFLDDNVVTYTISGQVRDDFDLDGILTDADRPVGGVQVRLYADVNGNGVVDPGELLMGTTQTDATGHYTFTNLPDGSYLVAEIDPQGATSTADIAGSLTDNLIPVTIAGASSVGNDFLDAVDPAGYIYSSATGQIIPGGTVSVSGPGAVTILMNGSTGQYSFLTDGTAGTYTISYTPPAGWVIDPTRPVAGASFDPTGGPNPTTVGSAENPANPGYLLDYSSATNTYYLTFDLAAGDPLVINNNLPLIQVKATTWAEWQYQNPLGGQNGAGSNPDGDRWSNLQEFVYCFDPLSGIGECPIRLVFNANATIDACVRTVNGITGVTYRLEYIADLNSSGPNGANWTDSGIMPDLVVAADGTQEAYYRDIESLLTGSGYVRSVVEVDTDNNSATAPETVRSNVEGWMDQTIPVNCESICLPFDACPRFSGAAETVTGNSIKVASAIGSQSLATLWEPGKSYYLDVLSGAYEGHRFEIDTTASIADTLVIAPNPRNTMASLPALAGAGFAVRAYRTLTEEFPPADYSVATDSSDADYVLMLENGSWETYYLIDLSGIPRWVNTDTGTADRGGHLLDPGAGLFVHRHVNGLFQTQSGSVREAKFARPLPVGYSFIPNPWPVAASIADRALINPSTASATPFNGAASMAPADRVLLWRADTTAGQFSYDARFYLKAGALNYYSQAGSSSLINSNGELIFRPLRSQYLNMKSSHLDYIMPVPWTP